VKRLSRDRFRGCLLGLACGDAVGTTLESKPPGTFTPIADMVGGGPYHLQAGQFTDATSMALCLADSLIACGGLNPKDTLDRWVRWWERGDNSVTGPWFDIDTTVRGVLSRYKVTGRPFVGSADPQAAGNGCLVRLAPVPMLYARDVKAAMRVAGDSCRLTHGAPQAVACTQGLARLLVWALEGEGKGKLLLAGGDGGREPPQVRGSGYVVHCLEAALWAFRKGTSFREVVLRAANLGDDSDGTAAVAGQLAGAHYGESDIPPGWLRRLCWASQIGERADRLYELAHRG
jgi:ADP-ribosyl-[dinitrogen reductase] hydrolase